MKIAIIGAGLIGEKRSLVIKEDRLSEIKWVVDIDQGKARRLAEKSGGVVDGNWRKVMADAEVDVVIVSTTHDWLARISLAALKAGKHVLCEKPLGINSTEIKKCVDLAKKKGLVYKAGYNHRFHPAILKMREIFDRGKIGNLMYIKADYGHGGRPGYQKEWRMNRTKSGGGETIDQGAHLIDLSNWFMDRPAVVKAETPTCFWPVKVEDNMFVILNKGKKVAQLHAGWTEWKNKFVFEIYGKKGYLLVHGLGGSYGKESLTFGVRIPGKAPKEKVFEFEEEDLSWKREWKNMKEVIKGNGELIGSGREGLEVMRIIENIYG